MREARADYEVKEIRFLMEPEKTIAFIHLGPSASGTVGIQGWHRNDFPAHVSVSLIASALFRVENPAEWPLENPPGIPSTIGSAHVQ